MSKLPDQPADYEQTLASYQKSIAAAQNDGALGQYKVDMIKDDLTILAESQMQGPTAPDLRERFVGWTRGDFNRLFRDLFGDSPAKRGKSERAEGPQ